MRVTIVADAAALGWSDVDDSPRAIREVLARHGLALKKRWGQNFMVNRRSRERIVDLLDPVGDRSVWEVGPGLGAITAILVDRGALVTAFEVDHGLIAVLRDRFADRVPIVAGDAARTIACAYDRARESGRTPERIVGNLPYRSAAAIVTTLLEHPGLADTAMRMVFTVQKEMARRMAAPVGGRDYSPLTVLCATCADVRLAGDLSAGSFYPAPEVTSSIVVLDVRPTDTSTRAVTTLVARALFSSRRKTIANNLSVLGARSGLPVDRLRDAADRAGISLDLRAERVGPGQFARFADELIRGGYRRDGDPSGTTTPASPDRSRDRR